MFWGDKSIASEAKRASIREADAAAPGDAVAKWGDEKTAAISKYWITLFS